MIRGVITHNVRSVLLCFTVIFILSRKFEMLSQHKAAQFGYILFRRSSDHRIRTQPVDIPHSSDARLRHYFITDFMNEINWIDGWPGLEKKYTVHVELYRREDLWLVLVGQRSNLPLDRSLDIIFIHITLDNLSGLWSNSIEAFRTLSAN
jgi:hypothetical protein